MLTTGQGRGNLSLLGRAEIGAVNKCLGRARQGAAKDVYTETPHPYFKCDPFRFMICKIVVIAGWLNAARPKVMRVTWLIVVCLCFPLHSWAQSQKSRDVVSVRELSIPSKAHRAFEHGVELLVRNNASESLPLFQRAAGEFAGYYEAYYEMGVADLKLRRLPDAAQAFQESIDRSGAQYSPPLLALGAIFAYQGKYSEAEGVIDKGLALDPESWSGHYYLGWVLSSVNRLEEAEKSVREAVRLKSDSPEAMRLLADIHSREKDYRSLVNDLDEYLKLDSDSPIAVRARALRATAQRLLDESRSNSALVSAQN